MAETLLSPGVLTRENDRSQITQGPITAGAAIIGPTVSGPVRIPTLVTSYSDYLNKFGGSFISGGSSYEYLTSISTYNYFQQGGNTLLVTRAVSGTFSPATSSAANNTSLITGSVASASFTVLNSSTGSWNQIQINASTAVGNLSYVIYNYPYTATGSYFDGSNYLYIGVGNGTNDGTNAVPSTGSWATNVVNAVNGGTGGVSTYFSASFTGGILTFFTDATGTAQNAFSLTSSFGIGTPLSVSFVGGTDGTPNTVFTLETLSQGNINNSFSTEISSSLISVSNVNVIYEIIFIGSSSWLFVVC
jgi:hypothetical protein